MNRYAKKFRVLSSLCILLNLVALFLPVTRRIQENYGDLTWSQMDYIQGALAKYLPFWGDEVVQLTTEQAGLVFLFMIMPLVLAVIAGIWGMTGNYVQKISSILAFAVLLLYIGMSVSVSSLWPELEEGQEYMRGIACTLTLIFSGCGAAAGIAALIATPGKVKVPETSIPQVEEIKQQQVEAQYNIMMEEKQESPRQENQKKPVHGVLLGVTGIYAGAEIPLTDGEYILLGRESSNHLVFEGQPGVSRNHCRIKWDAMRQKYIFRDYSSNGSFVNGSEDCLPQNLDLELEPGTMIAIGDERNTFCLQ